MRSPLLSGIVLTLSSLWEWGGWGDIWGRTGHQHAGKRHTQSQSIQLSPKPQVDPDCSPSFILMLWILRGDSQGKQSTRTGVIASVCTTPNNQEEASSTCWQCLEQQPAFLLKTFLGLMTLLASGMRVRPGTRNWCRFLYEFYLRERRFCNKALSWSPLCVCV